MRSSPRSAGRASSRSAAAEARRFRSNTNLVRVDVVVRDKNGNVVRGLKAADFVVTEDGKAQQVTSFDFEEIATEALPAQAAAPTFSGSSSCRRAASARPSPRHRNAPSDAGGQPASPQTVEDLPGRRLIVLLFDTSSMQPEEIDRAVKSADEYVDKQMTPADLVAVASVGQTLTILHEFTADRDALKTALARVRRDVRHRFRAAGRRADTTDVTDDADTDPADLPLDDSEFGIFNNDRRLRAMRVLCEALAPIEQKKALLYFSSGMSRSGSDNEVELRAVTNTCNQRQHVDLSGGQPRADGGRAGRRRRRRRRRGGGGGGSSVFSGRSMISQFSSLNASQETLTTLAADTGGQAFLDTNDFGPAFTRVQRDMSAYYLLGYSSTNTSKDGKFRKITVKLKNTPHGYKLEARTGYYAAADFAHLGKEDRERQLQEQIAAAVSATDLPVVASTTLVPRSDDDKFYVPVSVAVPGSAVKVPTQPTFRTGRTRRSIFSASSPTSRARGRPDSRHDADSRGAGGRPRDQTAAVPVRRDAAGGAFQSEGRRA